MLRSDAVQCKHLCTFENYKANTQETKNDSAFSGALTSVKITMGNRFTDAANVQGNSKETDSDNDCAWFY